MEFFDYFTRLSGMDPTQLPLYVRMPTFIVPIVIAVYAISHETRISEGQIYIRGIIR